MPRPTTQTRNPTFRFLNLIRLLLFVDLVTSNVLWLVGGDSDYLTDNVIHFKMELSVFDLAVTRSVVACNLIGLYTILEGIAMKRVSGTKNGNSKSMNSKIWWFLTFLLTVASLAYSIVKFWFMNEKHRVDPKSLHMSYYALAIASLAFSSVEFMIFFANIMVLKNVSVRYSRFEADGKVNVEEGHDVKEKKTADLRRLFSLAKPEGWLLAFGTLGLIGSSGSMMVAPLFFGKVIDSALKPTLAPLNKTILELFVIYTGGGISAFFRTWCYTLAGQRIVARLRRNLFQHIISQEVSFFDSTRTGELMNRLSSDSQVIQNAVTVNISMLVRYALQILGSLGIMFAVSPKLTGVLLAVVPVVAICAQRYGSYMRDLMKKFQDKLADASTTSEESIGNIRTVKAFSQEPKTAALYAKDINESYAIGATLAFANGLFQAGMSVFAQGSVVLVLWYGGKLVHDGGMSLGTLTAFMLYTLNVAMAFAFLSSLYGDFMKAVGASIRIFELFDREPKIKSGTSFLTSLEGVEIKFEDVSFRYPSRPDTDVLKDVSFCIKPGETVALVGPSGGGKSTIISMIERFYDPEKGAITVGKVHLPQIDIDWFRKKTGIVNQEPVLFATTIAENIAYGKEASEEEIIDAAKQANAHKFISEFEDGYKTTVGERGIKLSGGQKQRVAIARALLLNPEILLLDEATSALDAESEHLVKEAIDRAMVGRTVLVIAHRLSTVRNASRVLVIDKGEIVEQGTHDQLIQKEGTYKKLVLRQLNFGDGMGSLTATPSDTPTGSPKPRRRNQIHEQQQQPNEDREIDGGNLKV